MPMIFGAFFAIVDDSGFVLNAEWTAIYNQNKETVLYLVPLMPSLGIVIIVIKVLMTASARGRD